MRLSEKTIRAIVHGVDKNLPENAKPQLRLHGSRVDDELKGGDIDLLLITETPEQASYLRQHKAEILAAIFMQIDEQKIDLLIVDAKKLNEDPFTKTIYPQSILLKQW